MTNYKQQLKTHLRTADTNHIAEDEFFAEISRDWQGRAKRLQARRWRKIDMIHET